MGVLDRFEKGIERAVNGVFAKAFRSEVQPVEIASAMRKACDERAAVVSRGRTLVPNAYVVELGPSDHERLGQYAEALQDELAAGLREHAQQQGYTFVGPLTIELEESGALATGVFRLRTATLRDRAAQQPAFEPEEPVYRSTTPSPITAASPTRRPWLEIDGHAYPLVGSTTVVGRGEEADIVVDDPGVSRRHVEIRVAAESGRLVATARDLGSTNGTFVDGERRRSEHLVDGTALSFGRTRATYRTGER